MYCNGPVVYTCNSNDITKQFSYRNCITNHKHLSLGTLQSLAGISDTDCIASGANNVTVYMPHACYGLAIGSVVTYPTNITNISVVAYKNISYWHYLKQSIETQYDLNGLNPITTTTDFNYNNSVHLQLTSQLVTNSKGEFLTTEYKYPLDLIGVEQTTYMQQLVDANRIGEPVITKTFNGIAKLSENHTKYGNSSVTGNLLLPTEIHSRKGATDISITAIEDRKIQFALYDTNGTILQYTPENGTPVSIIWGYNKTQPIAKIENATYASITPSLIATAQTASESGTEASLIIALSNLRNGLPNAMVTTYTHKLLIGISTITDPKGDKMTYEYDQFNRLKNLKDKDGNILSENEYHYKN